MPWSRERNQRERNQREKWVPRKRFVGKYPRTSRVYGRRLESENPDVKSCVETIRETLQENISEF